MEDWTSIVFLAVCEFVDFCNRPVELCSYDVIVTCNLKIVAFMC